MWRYWPTPCSLRNVAMGIRWRCLPLAGESRQTPAAVAFLGAVASVEAAVVPPCAHAGGDGEVRKPAWKRAANVKPLLLLLSSCGFCHRITYGLIAMYHGISGTFSLQETRLGVSQLYLDMERDLRCTCYPACQPEALTIQNDSLHQVWAKFFGFWATMGSTWQSKSKECFSEPPHRREKI